MRGCAKAGAVGRQTVLTCEGTNKLFPCYGRTLDLARFWQDCCMGLCSLVSHSPMVSTAGVAAVPANSRGSGFSAIQKQVQSKHDFKNKKCSGLDTQMNTGISRRNPLRIRHALRCLYSGFCRTASRSCAARVTRGRRQCAIFDACMTPRNHGIVKLQYPTGKLFA